MNETKNADSRGQRGKSAIEAAHVGLQKDGEPKVDARISELYGVDSSEAVEIHTDYHAHRISSALERWARDNGMAKDVIEKKLEPLDIPGAANQVARGEVAEAAAIDMLFRRLFAIESKGSGMDRYVNFYG